MAIKKEAITGHFNGNYLPFYSKHLPKIKKGSNGQFESLCPFHAEKEPSFSINAETGLYNCFGCGASGDIFTFYARKNNRNLNGDFPAIIKGIAADHGIAGSVKPKQVARYIYLDADGNPLHSTVRTEPKSFYQCQYKNGKWVTGLKGVKPILYRLPEVIKADEIIVAEGEKDADALSEKGFTATTCPMGAGKWKDHYNSCLKGKAVVLIPDNDDEGRKHMNKVASSLQGVAASIKLIELPDLPEKGDVSDFLAKFTDDETAAERLSILIDGGEPYRVEEPSPLFSDEAHPEPPEDNLKKKYKWSDLGNAERLVDEHGDDLRYCHPFKKWFVYDGQRWVNDNTGSIKRKCKLVIRGMYTEAGKETDDDKRRKFIKYAISCESSQKIKAMLSLAESEPSIPVLPEQLDTDPWLLNCLNGTINLKTGELQPHNRDNLITKIVPFDYDQNASCNAWLDHLSKIMAGDQEKISFLQRAFGYSLTGDTSERVIFVEEGSGANGKSITNDCMATAMGDYAMRTPTETLLIKRSDGIPNDIARLRGARFVYASEAEQGKRLAESQIKDISGGEKISARFMKAEWFEFYPEFKIWLGTNHKPVIRGTDNAIWDRIRLIPFNVRIPENERLSKTDILALFQEEMPGILSWLVKGCLDWQQQGLNAPDAVLTATKGYRDEMDVIGTFIDDTCVLNETANVTVKALYESYTAWCDTEGEKTVSKKLFGMKLRERGFDNHRGKGGARTWKKIGLLAE